MDNENKCNKYEAFFIFQDEEAFNIHLKTCPDCQKEHEKYMKVSSLVKEAAPEYLEIIKTKRKNNLKKIACCLILFAGLTSLTALKAYDNYSFQVNFAQDSYIGTLGLPVDDYGFLEI